jgi:mannose-6-phosphate isomerase-like protein (cupin superfamily)
LWLRGRNLRGSAVVQQDRKASADIGTGTKSQLRPVVVKPAEGTQAWLLNDHGTIKLGATDTGGALHCFVNTSPAGGGLPPHLHTREDEMFFVLDGIFSFFLDGKTFRHGPGACVFLPKGFRTRSRTSAASRDVPRVRGIL